MAEISGKSPFHFPSRSEWRVKGTNISKWSYSHFPVPAPEERVRICRLEMLEIDSRTLSHYSVFHSMVPSSNSGINTSKELGIER